MGRSPCCDKVGLKRGPWTPEEDQKLLAYIEQHGHGSWRALPAKAGLERCGKSCRLRWTNYLRPDIKRGKFSLQEEQTIIQLHALLGNRWSAIATHLPKRTDNEIKNYWNTHLKKRLTKMGVDPVTHKPKNDALLSSEGHSKTAANLSHMAQWESARLEAEARLASESKLHSHLLKLGSSGFPSSSSSASSSSAPILKQDAPPPITKHSLDAIKNWNNDGGITNGVSGNNLESPTSTLSFSENNAPPIMSSTSTGLGENAGQMIEFVGTSGSSDQNTKERRIVKEESEQEWKGYDESSKLVPEYKDIGIENSSMHFTSTLHELTMTMDSTWDYSESLRTNTSAHVDVGDPNVAEERFTNLLLNASSADSDDKGLSTEKDGGESNNCDGSEFYEDNKNYWNSILNLVNSSPEDSSMF